MHNAPKQGHILRFERSEAKYVPLPWIVISFLFHEEFDKALCRAKQVQNLALFLQQSF